MYICSSLLPLARKPIQEAKACSVAYSPDDKFLAAADENGHVYVRPTSS